MRGIVVLGGMLALTGGCFGSSGALSGPAWGDDAMLREEARSCRTVHAAFTAPIDRIASPLPDGYAPWAHPETGDGIVVAAVRDCDWSSLAAGPASAMHTLVRIEAPPGADPFGGPEYYVLERRSPHLAFFEAWFVAGARAMHSDVRVDFQEYETGRGLEAAVRVPGATFFVLDGMPQDLAPGAGSERHWEATPKGTLEAIVAYDSPEAWSAAPDCAIRSRTVLFNVTGETWCRPDADRVVISWDGTWTAIMRLVPSQGESR